MKTKRFVLLLVVLLLVLLAGCTTTAPLSATFPNLLPLPPVEHSPGFVVQTIIDVILMLSIASIVSLISQRLRIPYTVGLVLVGFGLTFYQGGPAINITPELFLALLVPPLVYEAAFLLNFNDLRRELPMVLLMAIPGVILTTFLVGGMLSFAAGIALPIALVFGALISATDPVAVVALFRSMGAPKRLQAMLEGESLLNDGTAIVIYSIMVTIALTGQFNLGKSVVQFFIVAGGGILIGAVLGILVSQIISRINNSLVETSLTTVLAFGSYIVAEYVFGMSGVLAVVAAGLASGQIGPRGMSPTTRIVVFNFWDYAAFLANSFVFLLIGLQTNLSVLIQNLPAILWAILAVLIARVVTVYGFTSLSKDIPFRWKNVLFWGGLRGAISLSLALGLAPELPGVEQLRAMAFGVVLFTLLVEGLTMQPLILRSGVIRYSEGQISYEILHARAIAIRAAYDRLRKLNHQGIISTYTLHNLEPILKQQLKDASAEVRKALESEPVLFQKELADAWIESLRTQRNALTSLLHRNIITEETYTKLVGEVDMMLLNPASGIEALLQAPKIEKTIETS